MRRYIWVKVILIISNIILGIKALIWLAISVLSALISLGGMFCYGIGEYEIYMLGDSIHLLSICGVIPIMVSVCCSIAICIMSKRWIKYNLGKCKVALFLDSCIKTILCLVECLLLSRLIKNELTRFWGANVDSEY